MYFSNSYGKSVSKKVSKTQWLVSSSNGGYMYARDRNLAKLCLEISFDGTCLLGYGVFVFVSGKPNGFERDMNIPRESLYGR